MFTLEPVEVSKEALRDFDFDKGFNTLRKKKKKNNERTGRKQDRFDGNERIQDALVMNYLMK